LPKLAKLQCVAELKGWFGIERLQVGGHAPSVLLRHDEGEAQRQE